MRIITLAAAAALGALASQTLLKLRHRAEGAHADDRADTSFPRTGNADSARAEARLGIPEQAAPGDSADSPNAAERLEARHPAGALADAPAAGLGLTGPDSGETEYARTTGLADFSRGA